MLHKIREDCLGLGNHCCELQSEVYKFSVLMFSSCSLWFLNFLLGRSAFIVYYMQDCMLKSRFVVYMFRDSMYIWKFTSLLGQSINYSWLADWSLGWWKNLKLGINDIWCTAHFLWKPLLESSVMFVFVWKCK